MAEKDNRKNMLEKVNNKKTVDIARSAAVDLVYSVIEENSYSNLSLDMAFKDKNLNRQDRAFATAISYGTISHIVPIDEIIEAYSSVSFKKINPIIKTIIRIGIWQIFYSKSIPDFAVCNESVNLAKYLTNKVYSSFVNAILRKIITEKDIIDSKFISNPKQLYLRCSLPKELAGYFKKWFGEKRAVSICDAMNTPQSPNARVNTLKANVIDLKHELELLNCTIENSIFMDNAFSIKTNGVMLDNIPSFLNGEFVIQDEAAMLVSIVANPKPGNKVIDICAAPGGKTCHMAQLMQNKGEIIACDIHPSRLALVSENAQKTGTSIIECRVMDALNPSDEIMLTGKADIVLADVPCSGLGILGKKPDIKLNMTHEKIVSLYQVQYQILLNASRMVKSNGALVYSTCTMNPEENIKQIEKFLENNNDKFETVDITSLIPEKLRSMDALICETSKKGYINLYPDVHGCDGFFIAKLRRK